MLKCKLETLVQQFKVGEWRRKTFFLFWLIKKSKIRVEMTRAFVFVLSDPFPCSFRWHDTTECSNAETTCRYTAAHTVSASLSSLAKLHCFTADCEDCRKGSWWSLYFQFHLTNQCHFLCSPHNPHTPSSLSFCLLLLLIIIIFFPPKCLTLSYEDKHP